MAILILNFMVQIGFTSTWKGAKKGLKGQKFAQYYSLNSGVLSPKKVFHRFDTSIETLGLNISEN